MQAFQEIFDLWLGNRTRLVRQLDGGWDEYGRYICGATKILDENVVEILVGHGIFEVLVDSLNVIRVPGVSAYKTVRVDEVTDDFAALIMQIQAWTGPEPGRNHVGIWRPFFWPYFLPRGVAPARQFRLGTWSDKNIHRSRTGQLRFGHGRSSSPDLLPGKIK